MPISKIRPFHTYPIQYINMLRSVEQGVREGKAEMEFCLTVRCATLATDVRLLRACRRAWEGEGTLAREIGENYRITCSPHPQMHHLYIVRWIRRELFKKSFDSILENGLNDFTGTK